MNLITIFLLAAVACNAVALVVVGLRHRRTEDETIAFGARSAIVIGSVVLVLIVLAAVQQQLGDPQLLSTAWHPRGNASITPPPPSPIVPSHGGASPDDAMAAHEKQLRDLQQRMQQERGP